MFLLFLYRMHSVQKRLNIYIPICFYYFMNTATSFAASLIQFTFQYVSIISVIQLVAWDKKKYYLHSNMFLLFLPSKGNLFCDLPHLHSNMFLLFRRQFRKRNSNPSNLHSNMFLLFPEREAGIRRENGIYIPICFYYFFFWHVRFTNNIAIYIPICFYYFVSYIPLFIVYIKIYIPICFYYFEDIEET